MELTVRNGWGTAPHIWGPLQENLKNSLGVSETLIFRNYSWESALQDGISFEESGEETLSLGWSLGGILLLKAAASGSFRGKALILLSCAAGALDGRKKTQIRAMRENLEKDPEKVLREFFRLCCFPERPVPEANYLRDLSGEAGRREVLAHLKQGLDFLESLFFSEEELKKVECPCFILHGEEDKVFPLSEGEKLASLLPRSRFYSLPKASHALPLTRCDTISEILRTVNEPLPAGSERLLR